MNHFRAASLVLLVMAQYAPAQNPIRLKARTIQPGANANTVASAPNSRPRGVPRHWIVQFREYPGEVVRRELEKRGMHVLEFVPDNALMLACDRSPDLEGLDTVWSGVLEPSDKISPYLARNRAPAFLVVFHRDVAENDARAIASGLGFHIVPNASLLFNQLAVTGNSARLDDLAARDEVSYILPASSDIAAGAAVVACPGPIVEAGAIGEYAAVGSGWSKDASGAAALRYVISSLPAELDPAQARGEIERAIREWSKYANVSLTPGGLASAARTIAILFASKSHGDDYPFDGTGRVLAHTFYPAPPNIEPIAGDMHFDADETWRIGADTDLFTVALHELGHALGLGHSDDPGSVMYPYYRYASGLAADDVAGIRSLYGVAREDSGGGAEPDPEEPETPEIPREPDPPAATDRSSPAIRIVTPSLTMVSTWSASISLSGTASDNVGVTAVRWSTSNGDSGAASGAGAWFAKAPLLIGTNMITVRAYDAAGHSSWRSITVVRR